MGTTSIGFNLFLGGAMAEGKKLRSAQRGIAFSTLSAFVVSVLILIVGAGYHSEKYQDAIITATNSSTNATDEEEVKVGSTRFSITQLAEFLYQFVGQGGVAVYSVGFIAAALSSMLTVPLGAALTADSVFSDRPTSQNKAGADNPTYEEDDVKRSTKPNNQGLESETLLAQKLPHKIYLSIMFVMVIIATIVISANGEAEDIEVLLFYKIYFPADRTYVILVAQVFNGCLLPFFSTLLLLCLNDEQFMGERPQPLWANLLLVSAVLITMFLANNVVLTKIFGAVCGPTISWCSMVSLRLGVACGAAVVEMSLVILLTSLKRDLVRSLKLSSLGRALFERSFPISS